ncbi:hypothetical protein CYMTET_30806, partial [Cymbomonas tetramitiformis]
ARDAGPRRVLSVLQEQRVHHHQEFYHSSFGAPSPGDRSCATLRRKRIACQHLRQKLINGRGKSRFLKL